MTLEAGKQIRSLTGLRFLAALHVVVFHFGQKRFPGVLGGIVSSGYTAVSLFFVLSGFVLAYTYGQRERGRSVDRRQFWVARFARIYPLYALALAVALPLYLREAGPGRWLEPILVVSLTQAWLPSTAVAWNGPAWSLSVETFFYALFPLLLPLVEKLTSRFWRAMTATFLAAMLVPMAYVLWLGWEASSGSQAILDGSWVLDVVRFNPLLHLPAFVMGSLCGVLFLRSDRSPQAPRRAARQVVLAAAAVLAVLCASPHLPYPLLHNGLLAPLHCALIYGLAMHGDAFGRSLGSRPMVLLGEASYGMYLLHVPLQGWLRAAWERLGLRAGSAAFAAVYLVTVVTVPVLIFQLYEGPARRIIRAWFSRPRAASLPPAAL
jgi:peptidoglycan/LPS O-acetylase OafA/YrhL